jgi:hypothetical protein
MSEKIYQLYLSKGYTEAYFQLSAEAKQALWQRAEERVASQGGKFLISCRSRWCDETYQGWGVIEFPDIKAVQRVAELDEQDAFFRYVKTRTLLGLLRQGEHIPDMPGPDAVYQLFLMTDQGDNDWLSLAADERKRIFGLVMDSIAQHGGQTAIACTTSWSNEEISDFGIIAWPSADAVQAHFADLAKIGWHRYAYARTILGTKMVG